MCGQSRYVEKKFVREDEQRHVARGNEAVLDSSSSSMLRQRPVVLRRLLFKNRRPGAEGFRAPLRQVQLEPLFRRAAIQS